LPDLAQKLEQASSLIELDQADIARVIEANPRTVARWFHGETTPHPDTRELLLELIAVLEHLSGVLKPAAAHDWLFTPNPLLDHHKPVELLREREYRRVLGAIDALAEGVFA
jgi:putative toxin-antitoxin system antitoxin component (TIGR02293 family)